MFSRVIYGAQIDLLLGVVTTYASLAIGMVVGVVAGYYRGIREFVLMRLVDTLIAFPFFVLSWQSSAWLGQACSACISESSS